MANESVPTTPTELNPSIGFATSFGVLSTLLGLVGATIAAIKGNDTATAGASAGAILALVTTLGGRYAQAVQLAKNALVAASPWIDEAQKIAAGAYDRPSGHDQPPTGYNPPGSVTPIDPELPPN